MSDTGNEVMHTPMIGVPWHRSLTSGFVGKTPARGIATKDGMNVAWVSGHPIDTDAVMRAILTAVNAHDDLVAALKAITAIQNQGGGGDWDEIEAAREIARAALTKAQGL